MKMKIKRFLCAVLAAGMVFQLQPAYAATSNYETQEKLQGTVSSNNFNETALLHLLNAGETNPSDQTNADSTSSSDQTNTDNTNPSDQPDNMNPSDPSNPDDTNPSNPDDTNPSNPDGTEQPGEEEVKVPAAVTGLRTTAQSKTKVRIAWNESENAASYKVYRKVSGGEYKLISTVTKAYYIDKTVTTGKNYHYKIVPVNGEKKGKPQTIAFSNKVIVTIASQKYTYVKMKSQMKDLKAKYSDYCELTEIGKSVKGHSIYDFAIGNPDAETSLLVVGTLHAREYICAAVLMQELEYYLSNYNHAIGGVTPADTLENMQIHYIVMANPDGVEISQKSYPRWKSNARGVDLNRNFPIKKFVSGGKKGAEGYSGKKALSEPESRAVANLTLKLKQNQKLQGVVNYHAMGRIIYGSCSSKKLYKDTKMMYDIAKKETGYIAAPESSKSSGKASPGGQYREYVMYMLGIPSITIEVGKTWAPCSFYEYKTEFQKNKNVVLKIADAIS